MVERGGVFTVLISASGGEGWKGQMVRLPNGLTHLPPPEDSSLEAIFSPIPR